MSKHNGHRRVDRPGVIQSTGINNLRLQVFAVDVETNWRDSGSPVRFRAELRFPVNEQTGVRALFRSCEVEGYFSAFAWRRLEVFHDRLSARACHKTAPVELVAAHATLEQPRASVNETDTGFAAVAILRICIDDIECARIPGHRWRHFKALKNNDLKSPFAQHTSVETVLH